MRLAALALALMIVAAVAATQDAGAAPFCSSTQTINVTTTGDVVDSGDGQVSLREAIAGANSDDEPTVITFTNAGTYNLLGALDVQTDCALTIDGLGARVMALTETLDGFRVVDDASTAPVVIRKVSITGGRISGEGGGISNADGQLDLDAVSVRGNVARDGGGGIANHGTLNVTRSTISGNKSSPIDSPSASFGYGGGVANSGGATATLTDTTVSGNSAGNGSGGPGSGGGVANTGTLHIVSSTLANNTAAGSGGNVGGALGSQDRLNSLFAGGSPSNCVAAMSSPSSGDRSMSTDNTCTGTATPNLKLGPLLDNGGQTDTRALLKGSAAIDGAESLCPNDPIFPVVDQRGVTRPSGDCDVGAFEVVKTANLALAIGAAPNPVAEHAKSGLTYAITVGSTGPQGDATQPVVTDHLPAGVTLLRKTASQGKCTGAHKVVCALGTVPNGATATVLIRVRVDRSLGSLANAASVASPRPDAKPSDDRRSVRVVVRPSDGDDTIGGTKRADRLCGLLGDDTIRGRGGGDTLFGDGCNRQRGPGGRDALFGGAGGDTLTGGGGRNRLRGGRGDDVIKAVNGKADDVDCGKGSNDVAHVDPSDTVVGCETVKRA